MLPPQRLWTPCLCLRQDSALTPLSARGGLPALLCPCQCLFVLSLLPALYGPCSLYPALVCFAMHHSCQ